MSKSLDGIMKKLRHLLTTSSEFSDIIDYFFDVVAPNPELDKISRPKNNPLVRAAVAGGIEKFTGRSCMLLPESKFLYASKYKFYHGPLFLEGRMGTVLFFTDVNTGLLVLSTMGGQTDMIRLTTIVASENAYHMPENPVTD